MKHKTPNGIPFTTIDKFTYRHKKQIEGVLLKDVQVSTDGDATISAEKIAEMERKAVDTVVTSITIDGKEITENIYDAMLDLPVEDAEFIVQTVNKITGGQEKKLEKTD